MKRSEMLKTLKESFTKHMHQIDCTCETDAEMYEHILTDIETAGMLPPTITSMLNQYNRQEGTYGFEVNEWEDEDETK